MPGGVPPAGLEQYLDLLVSTNGGVADAASEEAFFRAVQAVNKPAIERQMNRIRSILQADPVVGSRLRDRADLERDLTKVRYQLAGLDPAQKDQAAGLESRRAAAQDQLTKLDAELALDPRLKLYDEQPATVARNPVGAAARRSLFQADRAARQGLCDPDHAERHDDLSRRRAGPGARRTGGERPRLDRRPSRRGPARPVRCRQGLYALPADRRACGGQAAAGAGADRRSERAAGAAADRRSGDRSGQHRQVQGGRRSVRFHLGILPRRP